MLEGLVDFVICPSWARATKLLCVELIPIYSNRPSSSSVRSLRMFPVFSVLAGSNSRR